MGQNKELKQSQEFLEEFLDDTLEQDPSPAEVVKHLKNIHKSDSDLFIEYVKQLPSEALGDVAVELPEDILKDVIEEIPNEQLKEAIEELESDDATDLLQHIEEIDEERAQELFEILDKEDQEDIKKLRQYNEEVAGAYMQTEVFKAQIYETIQEAIDRLRVLKLEGELENIYRLFIVDEFDVLRYSIALEDIITADFNSSFKVFLESAPADEYQPIVAWDDDSIEKVIELVEDYDLSVLPVIDHHGKLIGRITADDIHDIIQDSATEQMYNLAGVDDEAEEESTLYRAGRARAIWLLINLFTAFLAASVIGFFEDVIQSYVALAVLMPIVASMGGNAGTQALAVTVRQLALGEIDFTNAKETIKKEVTISTANGLLFSVIVGAVAFVWFGEPLLGVVIGSAMIINLFCAGLFGAIIPLTLKRFGVDPAVGSSVLLTTVTDVMGFFSFLGLAQLILIG